MIRVLGSTTVVAVLAAGALAGSAVTGAPSAAQAADSAKRTPDAAPPPAFAEGRAQPVYADDTVVRTDVWVEVPADTDGDGKRDRVHVEVARPASTQRGVDLPVIMQASPYYGGGNPVTNHDVDVPLYVPDKPGTNGDGEKRTGSRSRRNSMITTRAKAAAEIGPSKYEGYFLPRGFAFVYAESLGSGRSTGCPSIGDPDEIRGITSVIDWLNGRATAYDAKKGGREVTADWTTGQTGMIGTSYNGTLPNGAAATGVEGLEAIVPVSAISSWYNYYRDDGRVVAPGGYQGEDTDVLFDFVLTREKPGACDEVRQRLVRRQDRLTGDYSPFWEERNYVSDVDKVDAAVLVSHGLNDHNVKTEQFARWYAALRDSDVPHKIWLHQRGHGDWPYRLRKDVWLDTLNRWWTHWLYDVDNGVMEGPHATVQREDGSWVTYPEWPAPAAEPVRLHLSPGGRAAGGLSSDPARGRLVETLTDDPTATAQKLAETAASPHRLVYQTDRLDSRVRVSGAVRADLRLSFDYPAANVTTLLVDYGPDGSAHIVNRGWTDPQNRKSRSETTPITRGTPYSIDVRLQDDDYVFRPGHRIGIVVLSTDYHYTKRPPGSDTELALKLSRSSVTLPVVGGASRLTSATRD